MANRYFVFSGVNYSTSLNSNWSTFSNGAGGASLPGYLDSIYFDQFSPTCSADLTIASVSNISFTGYNKTFNFYTSSYNFYANGIFTLSPSMSWGSYSNTANLVLGFGGYGTVSSNGLTWSGNIVYHYRNYAQFSDDAVALGDLIIASNSVSNTTTFGLYRNKLSIYGNLSCITSTTSTNNFGSYGTTLIYLKATQSVSVIFGSSFSTARFFNNPIYIQASTASGATISFTGILNYNFQVNYPGDIQSTPILSPRVDGGIYHSTGNINMNNFSYYYTRSAYDGNSTSVRYPITLDLNGNFISQVVSLNISNITRTIGYIAPLRIASNITIGTLSIVATSSSFGSMTLYGGSTFSISNLYLDKYLYLGTTNSVYINNITHTGVINSHAQISYAPYTFNGNPASYSNATIVLPSTYSTSYLDVIRITVSQSSIIATSSIIINSINASNPSPAVYFIGNSATNSWFSQSNWSLSSGGAANANFIPDSGDTIYFDSNSGTCSLGATANAYNLDFTGYKNTIITNNSLNIWGNNLVISPSMSFTGSSGLILNMMTASINTNNFTFSVPVTALTPYLFYYNWYPNVYYNFTGNLISNNSLLFSGQHFYGTYNLNNSNAGLSLNTTFNISNNNFIYSNNSFNSLYSSIFSSTFSFGATRFSFDTLSLWGSDMLINAGSGTFTMSNLLSVYYSRTNKIIKYISGTTSGNSITIANNGTYSFDLNSNNIGSLTNTTGFNLLNLSSPSSIAANSNIGINLISPLNITGTVSLGHQATDIIISGSILYCGGVITFKNYTSGGTIVDKLYTYGSNAIWRPSDPTGNLISTSNISVKELIVATESILSMGTASGVFYAPYFYNTNMYIYGTLSVGNYGSITSRNTSTATQSSMWIYGNVDKTNGNFNLIIGGTISLYIPNTTIDNLYLYQSINTAIIPQNTLNITNFRADYYWTSGGPIIAFTGSYGLNINNFYHDTTGTVAGANRVNASYLFNNGITYSFSGTFSVFGNYLYTAFSSYTASNPAKLILNQGTKINANYMNISNIDCSGGLTLRYFKGTSTNSPNTLSFNTTDFLPIINSGMS